jgi:hypothetical protein
MFLKKLVLHNIRSIEHLELSFDQGPDPLRRWTLVLGENGVGKSTILRSLALALAGGEGLQDLLANPVDWVRKGSDLGTILVEVVAPDGACRAIKLSLSPEDDRRTILTRNAGALDLLDSFQKLASHGYLTIGYGVSRRLSTARVTNFQKGESFISRRAQALATLFDPNATLYPLDTWAIDLHYRRGDEGLDLIRAAFKDLLQGIEFATIDREERELLFDTPDGPIPLRSLSDGYQDIAGWWGDLLFRITDILSQPADPLSAPGVLLIDEVDLHLHPTWQRQLRDFLTQRLPHFQIITTSHSPLAAQQCAPGELFFLQRPAEYEPPVLSVFEGDPRLLKIQQLIASPLFGLDTAASSHVENLRKEYVELKEGVHRGGPESEAEQQFQQVVQELSEIPDAARLSERERKQQELLAQINKSLKK